MIMFIPSYSKRTSDRKVNNKDNSDGILGNEAIFVTIADFGYALLSF